jgi:hypothetical protein
VSGVRARDGEVEVQSRSSLMRPSLLHALRSPDEPSRYAGQHPMWSIRSTGVTQRRLRGASTV